MTAEVINLRDANTVPKVTEFREIAQKSSHTFRFPFVFDGTEKLGGKMQWTIKNLLIAGGLSVIYGPPKSGKSFLAQDAAYRIAHGMDFFGNKTSQGLVVYICAEGSTGFRQRMTAWREANGMPPSPNFIMLPSAIDLVNDASAIDALIADLKAISKEMGQPIAMIVIDTLARSFGGANENDTTDMNKFVGNTGFIQDCLYKALGFKPHVCVVHHCGKDVKAGMRGSNALLGAADATIEVTVNEADGIRQARVADLKDASKPDPFYYRLRSMRIGTDDDGDGIYSCAVEPTTMVIPDGGDNPFAEKPKGTGKRGRKPAKAA